MGGLSLPLRFSARFWSRSVAGLGRVAPNALFGGCRRPAAGRFPAVDALLSVRRRVAYIRTHPGSVPTVKQHLAAIRAARPAAAITDSGRWSAASASAGRSSAPHSQQRIASSSAWFFAVTVVSLALHHVSDSAAPSDFRDTTGAILASMSWSCQ